MRTALRGVYQVLDLDANPRFRILFLIARRRVVFGFLAASVGFVFAEPTWLSLSLGGLVAGGGECVRIWAAGHLVKGREVTTSGPYRMCRHPLYLGSVFIGIGFVVAAASLLVAVVIFFYLGLMIPVAMRLEEATLSATFGNLYTDYAQGKARWSDRRFSWKRASHNGEYLAVSGLLLSIFIIGVKAWWANGYPF